ncbi:UvrD-helicase domain-containing protein [Capnocytophaga cynodegmi]|uniref:UvrD-helicase domain-containing protein n=1 Tax=Capnocytophaga cynodegmi TaxID=28189 RepID=UPI00385C8B4A
MHQEITITNEDIQYAEQILLSERYLFDNERRNFIKNLETLDLQAVPGSGKTTALLAKLIILERKLPFTDGSGILVLSHTNAAIDEIKNKIQSYCPKLFQYPNFIGTIQSFVDNFLAIPYYTQFQKKKPYRIDDEIYNEFIHKKLTNISPYRYNLGRDDFRKIRHIKNSNDSIFYKIRFCNNDNSVILSDKSNGEKFDVKKPKGKTKNYNDYTNEEKDKLYNWFLQFKKNILEDGILNFDDTYFLANRYLQKFPTIKKIIQKRFSYVFVDEMQDMAKHQYDLLENLFYDNGNCSSKFQRIGDKNQAIYNDIENENNWVDREQALYLSNSHRLSPNIANVVKKFALNYPNGFDIVGKNNCDIKPHIILYDDNSKESVISKFAELVQEFRNQGKLSDFEKYPIKAICWTSWKNEDSQRDSSNKVRLEDYFPNYQKNEAKPKQNYSCLMDYLLYYDKNSKTLNAVQNNIINAFLKILHLENIVSDKGYYTKTKLMNVLREKNTIFYEQFRLKIFNWSLSLLKGNLEEVCNEIKNYVNDFLNFIDNKTINNSSDFINQENQEPSTSISTTTLKNNYYNNNEINIEVTNVHSVKGQTHCATLYLESFYHSDGGKSYESERLVNAFLGSFITNGKKRIQQSLKMAYVGFSRPTNLLCVAIHKSRFDKHLSDIDKNVWEIINT